MPLPPQAPHSKTFSSSRRFICCSHWLVSKVMAHQPIPTHISVAPHLGYVLPYSEFQVLLQQQQQQKKRAQSLYDAFGPTGAPFLTGTTWQSKAFILQPLSIGVVLACRRLSRGVGGEEPAACQTQSSVGSAVTVTAGRPGVSPPHRQPFQCSVYTDLHKVQLKFIYQLKIL